MAKKFCTQCGAPLDPDMKFCTKCGAPVDASDRAADVTVPISQAAASNGADATAPFEKQAGQYPAKTPSGGVSQWQQAAPAGQQVYDQPPQKKGASKTLLAVIIAAIAVVLAAGVIVVLRPWENSSSSSAVSAKTSSAATASSATASSTTATASSDSSKTSASQSSSTSASSTSSASSSSASQTDYYNDLLNIYNSFDGYNNRIHSCVDEFNDNYSSGSYSTRKSCSDTAAALKTEISNMQSKLHGLGITSSSKYYSEYQSLDTLANDLYQRVSVLCEAWDLDLVSSNISADNEKIIAPILRDRDSSGSNKYKVEYDNLYPNAKPTQK